MQHCGHQPYSIFKIRFVTFLVAVFQPANLVFPLASLCYNIPRLETELTDGERFIGSHHQPRRPPNDGDAENRAGEMYRLYAV